MADYHLRYLPQFQKDLKEAALYISTELLNPQAASDLIDAVEQAILKSSLRLNLLNSSIPGRNVNFRIIAFT